MIYGMIHMHMACAYITCCEYIQLDIIRYMYVYYICAIWYVSYTYHKNMFRWHISRQFPIKSINTGGYISGVHHC